MEKIAEMFDSLRTRFSNPLYFSFIFSWLICNWKIVLAVLIVPIDQIYKAGYLDIFQFISCNINYCDSLIYPLVFALFYTFIFPYVNIAINSFNACIFKRGNTQTLKILESATIPYQKYIQLQTDYNEKLKSLSHSESERTQIKDEIETLKNDLQIINQKYEDSERIISNLNNISYLNGYWEVEQTYVDTDESIKTMHTKVYIDKDEYYLVISSSEKELNFYVQNFYMIERNNSIFFNLLDRSTPDTFYPVNLTIEKYGILVGTINGKQYVRYKKI